MIVSTVAGATSRSPGYRPRLIRGPLLACLLAVLVQVLDMTMLATALPAIARDLRLPALPQVLVVSGYSLAFGCTLIVGAHLGDRFGRRRVYTAGMAGFAVCAAWCAMAGGGTELVAARCVQGMCGALVAAQTLAIITTSFGPRRRTVAFAAHSATGAFAALAGPVLGGILVDTDPLGLGWRSVFLAELSIGLVAVAAGLRLLPRERSAVVRRFDTSGAVLGIALIAVLLYPAIPVGGSRSVLEWSLVGVVVAVLLPVVVYRGRGGARAPAFPSGLFARREFALGAVAVLGFSAIFAGVPVTMSNTVQLGLGFTARETGLLLLPSATGAVVGALTAPILVNRSRNATLTAGILLFGLATAAVALLIDPGAGRFDIPTLMVPLAVAGIGLGWFAAPLPALLMGGIDPAETGPASGLVPTLQQLGGALGPVVLLTRLDHGTSGAPARDHLIAFGTALWIVVGLAAVLAVIVLALPRGR
ncbi:MFS transporter [Nocardia sp. NPDC051750]|uniref:MFS transporter n=1 Tax=Nocardia sp. NPDC051750 TaxID=3364325 RepID=UPI0037B25556